MDENDNICQTCGLLLEDCECDNGNMDDDELDSELEFDSEDDDGDDTMDDDDM